MRRSSRSRAVLTWIVAVLVTLVVAGWQRRSGPTWPVTVRDMTGGHVVGGTLPRTHPGPGGPTIELVAPAPLEGDVSWRRWPTSDRFARVPMQRRGDRLACTLPHFPPAAKIEYRVLVRPAGDPGGGIAVPRDRAVVLRYRGDVPAAILVPHILAMFGGLLLGVRLALGALLGQKLSSRELGVLVAVLVAGGLVLGPLVQKAAFGAYWTGWPVGEDLTDTKTLVTTAGWMLAWIVALRRPRAARWAILAAAALMLAVYFVPHSVRGSQLDWQKVPAPPVTATPSD